MSFLSGQYPHNHGYYGLKGPLPTRLPNLFSQLREEGYYTGAISKIHLPEGWIEPSCDCFSEAVRGRSISWDETYEEFMAGHGFSGEEYRLSGEGSRSLYANHGLDGSPDSLPKELSREGYSVHMTRKFFENKPEDKPFFLWFTVNKPHQEYEPAQEFWDLYDGNLPMPPSADDDPSDRLLPFRKTLASQKKNPQGAFDPADYEAVRKRKFRAYYGNISHMDWAVGEVLSMLEENGWTEDTIVIYTTDHGEYACEHGLLEKAPGISSDAVGRIPFIWSWPGCLPEGERRSQLAESVDLWPTLASLAGLPKLSQWDGKDITDILQNDGAEVRQAAFTEHPLSKTITTKEWRLTYVPETMFPEDHVKGELYDRKKDPWERTNLYHDPQHSEIVRELRARILDWLVTTTRPVTAHGVSPHPSFEDTWNEYTTGNKPHPEDGKTSTEQIRTAIDKGSTNYL